LETTTTTMTKTFANDMTPALNTATGALQKFAEAVNAAGGLSALGGGS
jgi:hypothetical protein